MFAFFCVAALGQQPRIDSVSPSQGPIAGSTVVTLRGVNFTNATVTFDNVAVTPLAQSDSELSVTTPKHSNNGYAIVRVTTAAGTAATPFLYLPPALRDLPAGYITTIAGVGEYYGDYRSALEASVAVGEIAYGPDGSLYVADLHHKRIVRVRPDGILEPFAGTGRSPQPSTFKNPAPRLEISMEYARSIVVEDDGDVIIADEPSNYVWRVEAATGLARVIAGTGKAGFSGDGGLAATAEVSGPNFVVGDRKGTLWFLDAFNARIRRITPDGKIVTIAGNGTLGFSGDGGPATQAQFDAWSDVGNLAYDPEGFLYLADYFNKRIRRINLNAGTIETFVGPERNYGLKLNGIRAITVGPNGDVYFNSGSAITHVARDGVFIEQWGSEKFGLARTYDGTRLSDILLGSCIGLTLDPKGNLLYADDDTYRVMRMNRATGLLETVVSAIGPGAFGENGPALAAAPIEKIGPYPDIIVTPAGEIIFSGRRIRKIGLDGMMTVIAGTGQTATIGDGVAATQASYTTAGLDIDPTGNLYAAAFWPVVQIDSAGILRKYAGQTNSQQCGLDGDGGPALNARLCQPWDVALDKSGNLFIADTNNNRIRRVDAKTRLITTVAGSGAVNGWEGYHHGTSSGDGGPALSATINTPVGVAVNSEGELVITEDSHLRKVDRSGVISSLSAESDARYPVFDAWDNLYTTINGSVVRFTAAGGRQILAGPGNGANGFGGDGGPANKALLSGFGGIGWDAEGNLYFVDGGNWRIRAVRYGAVLAPPDATIAATSSGTTIRATVRDSTGHEAARVRVDFSAPSSGPSCTLSSPFGITDRSGSVSVRCTPNCIAGTYTVAARPLTASSVATVTMTNSPCPPRRRAVGR